MRLVLIVMVPKFVSTMVIVNHDKEIATPAPVPPQGKNTCLLFTVVTVIFAQKDVMLMHT